MTLRALADEVASLRDLHEHLAARGYWVYLERDGTRQRTTLMAARGLALRVDGPGRFARADRFLRRLQANLPDEARWTDGEPLPIASCFAGFSSDAFEGASAWAGWPNLAMLIPDLMAVEESGEVRLFATPAFTADGDAEWSRRSISPRGANIGRTRQTPVAANTDTDAERRRWFRLVDAALTAIHTSSFAKLVPARARVVPLAERRRWSVTGTIDRLATTQPTSTVFCVQSPDGAAFLGATPELLVRLHDGEIESMALAGTVDGAGGADVETARRELTGDKNSREHGLVRDDIVANLARSGVVPHASSTPEMADFGTIKHLRTPIRAAANADTRLLDLVANLHPTPAVSGTPVEASRAWLAEHERLERGYYTGPFGHITASGDGAFHVALRCALLTRDAAHIYAGAGVVDGSVARSEWEETGWKLSTLASALVCEPCDSATSTDGVAAGDDVAASPTSGGSRR